MATQQQKNDLQQAITEALPNVSGTKAQQLVQAIDEYVHNEVQQQFQGQQGRAGMQPGQNTETRR